MAKQKKSTERSYNSQDLIKLLQPKLTPDGKLTVQSQPHNEPGMALIRLALGRLLSRTPSEDEAKNVVILLRGRGLERPRIESAEIKGALSAPQPEVTTAPPSEEPAVHKNRNEELLNFLESLFPNDRTRFPCLTPDRKPVLWLEDEEEYCPIPSDPVRAWIFGQSVAKRRRPLTGVEMSAALQWLTVFARERGELEFLSTDGSGEFDNAVVDEAAANPLFLALQQYLRAMQVAKVGDDLEVLATDACNELAAHARAYHPNAKAFNPDPTVLGRYIRKNASLLERFVGVRFSGTHKENGMFWRFERVKAADEFAIPETHVPERSRK